MTTQSIFSQVKQATVAKLLTAGLLAGAVALAIPAKASAQEVYFGGSAAQFDRDGDRRAFYEHERFEAIRREQFRREEWRREHSFYDRDRRFGDDERRFDRERNDHYDRDRRFDR